MRHTKEQFVDRWLEKIAGMALRGLVLDTDERTKGPFGAGAYALKIPEKVRLLLAQMYDDLKPPAGSVHASNGKELVRN